MTDTRRRRCACRRASAALVILIAATGCASGDILAYHEKDSTTTALAVLEIAPDLEIIAVDSNRSWSGTSTVSKPVTVYFPEGNHSLSIRLRRDEQEGQMVAYEIETLESDAVDLDGYFRSGRVYRIGYRHQGASWQPTIQDVTPRN